MIKCKNEHRINEVIKLHSEGKGTRIISKELDIPRSTLSYMMKKYNLKNQVTKSNSINLSDFQRSLLIGTILGDSYISNRYKSSYINFAHCEKQEEYYNHKIENLGLEQSYNKKVENLDKRTDKLYSKFSYTSKSYLELKDYRNIFYKNNIKIIPIDFIEKYFDEISLAYMYMDDGNYTKESTTIATCCFSREEIKKFNKFLKKKFNLEFTILGNKSIRIRQKDKMRFFELIDPYIKNVNCMSYKSPL